MTVITAADAGLLACHACHLLSKQSPAGHDSEVYTLRHGPACTQAGQHYPQLGVPHRCLHPLCAGERPAGHGDRFPFRRANGHDHERCRVPVDLRLLASRGHHFHRQHPGARVEVSCADGIAGVGAASLDLETGGAYRGCTASWN